MALFYTECLDLYKCDFCYKIKEKGKCSTHTHNCRKTCTGCKGKILLLINTTYKLILFEENYIPCTRQVCNNHRYVRKQRNKAPITITEGFIRCQLFLKPVLICFAGPDNDRYGTEKCQRYKSKGLCKYLSFKSFKCQKTCGTCAGNKKQALNYLQINTTI